MNDPFRDALKVYAKDVRDTMRHMPPNVELALAPIFNALLKAAIPAIGPAGSGLTVIAEYTKPAVGRPDIALKRGGAPAAAFLELKAPDKLTDPATYKGHDKAQWQRFRSLPTWALSNFREIVLYRRDRVELEPAAIVPRAALDPATTDAKAEKLIEAHPADDFRTILARLAQATPPSATNAEEVATNLAHAARLVRDVIRARLAEFAEVGATGLPLHAVRDEFREVLYAHPKAAGYPDRDFDELFAAAFAQTFAFGLLLVREATGRDVGKDAYEAMPPNHPLLRSTLRVLMQEEIASDLGAGLDVMLGTVNATDPELLNKTGASRDPILYFYEDFLGVFDAEAKKRHGVFYTPVDVVRFQVAAVDRVLRNNLGTSGLLDERVTVLDPAVGTGTYPVACITMAAERAGARGPGMVSPALHSLAERLFGLELLVGPYAVAHYRMHHELAAIGAPLTGRLNIYLADTLAEPGTSAPLGKLGFIARPIADEREAADRLKQSDPILAIIGNPPYRRLQSGETEELVGQWMNGLWNDLKDPVSRAGWGGDLQSFPDLYIAFWRWALWKLFDAPSATHRGVVCFITNRTFLAGHTFAGLRKMMRERFDRIEIFDLRGDLRRGARAGVEGDQGVFDIQAGTAITLAWATGNKSQAILADVIMHDAWAAGAFSRAAKLEWLERGIPEGRMQGGVVISRGLLEDMRPTAFAGRDWPGLTDCFVFRSSGMETKRDHLVYAISATRLTRKIRDFIALADQTAASDVFNDTAMNTAEKARRIPFDPSVQKPAGYRPFDTRWHYRHKRYNDRLRTDLQAVWGDNNICLYALPGGTGAGPAVWCHALLPDRHAFRGSYGGNAFPLRDQRPLAPPHNFRSALLRALTEAYERDVGAEDVFDAILCLLSARSYSAIFGEDLEDAFPHVPFPRDGSVFARAVKLGHQMRALETFTRPPGRDFLSAKVMTAPSGPLHPSAWKHGGFTLCADGSGRIEGVPREVWDFSVSGYDVLPRWLEHRTGEAADYANIEAVCDLCGRIAELLGLMAEADPILSAAAKNPLTKAKLGL